MEDNQFRHPTEEPMGAKLPEPERELPPKSGWQNTVLVVLGVLLIVGGIAIGVRNRDNSTEIVDLPEYTVSEEPTTTPEPTAPSASPKTPSSEATPDSSSAPAITYKAPKAPTYKKSVTKVVAKSVPVTPAATTTATANLPVYQAVVGLPDYQPQFTSPTPSPVQQTITFRVVTPGHTYTIEAYQSVTVAALMQAARSQGLDYETKQFSFGALVTSINGQSESSGHYWTFTKNGDFSQLGINEQTVGNGDVIAWTLAAI